ncbi:MAG: hypothetical protein ACREFY_01080 [Acetobacteraceae bacterium]
MRIAEFYSHLNGWEFIQVHKPTLWQEIVAAIAAVDAAAYRTKVSREKTMVGRLLYDPAAMNAALRRQFTDRGWRERMAAYYVTRDAKLIRRTLALPPEEQKRAIEAAGEQAIRS